MYFIEVSVVSLCPLPGPIFYLLLGVSSDYAQPITGQVTEVTCPVKGRAQSELTPSKRQKTDPERRLHWAVNGLLPKAPDHYLSLTSFILMSSWISNHIHYEMWDEVTYPYPNSNGATTKVGELVSNFIPDSRSSLGM